MEKATTNYVVDANVLITAANDYYAFDLVEGFWKCLKQHAKNSRVVSLDRIRKEITEKPGPLCDWAKDCGENAFVSTNRPDVFYYYGKIIQWVQSGNFTQAAVNKFADGADGWLIAYAKAAGHTVVTLEVAEATRKKVKIPIVCKEFNVPCVNTFAMLRDLRSRIG